mmetsp:Transcript_38020/g.74291  ORF Transcript_38020/g.74291 Transcript_38020/m.74291 type:complete len:320 (-) Transcript_38020:1409-2368(-)
MPAAGTNYLKALARQVRGHELRQVKVLVISHGALAEDALGALEPLEGMLELDLADRHVARIRSILLLVRSVRAEVAVAPLPPPPVRFPCALLAPPASACLLPAAPTAHRPLGALLAPLTSVAPLAAATLRQLHGPPPLAPLPQRVHLTLKTLGAVLEPAIVPPCRPQLLLDTLQAPPPRRGQLVVAPLTLAVPPAKLIIVVVIRASVIEHKVPVLVLMHVHSAPVPRGHLPVVVRVAEHHALHRVHLTPQVPAASLIVPLRPAPGQLRQLLRRAVGLGESRRALLLKGAAVLGHLLVEGLFLARRVPILVQLCHVDPHL